MDISNAEQAFQKLRRALIAGDTEVKDRFAFLITAPGVFSESPSSQHIDAEVEVAFQHLHQAILDNNDQNMTMEQCITFLFPHEPSQSTSTPRPTTDNRELRSLLKASERVLSETRYTRQSVVASVVPNPPANNFDSIRCYIQDRTILDLLRTSPHQPYLDHLENTGLKIDGYDVKTEYLHIYCKKSDDMNRVRGRWSDIQLAFRLPGDCLIVKDRFHVRAETTSNSIRDDLRKPGARNKCCRQLGQDYSVHALDVSYSYGHVIVELATQADAVKLRDKNEVFICGHRCTVHAFDKRALPMLCYKCGKPNHMQSKCPSEGSAVCLTCSSLEHETKACRSETQKCLNCGKEHATYSVRCRAPEVVAMMRHCDEWFRYGAEWSTKPEAVGRPPRPLAPPSVDKSARTDAPRTNSRRYQSTKGKSKASKKTNSKGKASDVVPRQNNGPVKIQGRLDGFIAKQKPSSG